MKDIINKILKEALSVGGDGILNNDGTNFTQAELVELLSDYIGRSYEVYEDITGRDVVFTIREVKPLPNKLWEVVVSSNYEFDLKTRVHSITFSKFAIELKTEMYDLFGVVIKFNYVGLMY